MLMMWYQFGSALLPTMPAAQFSQVSGPSHTALPPILFPFVEKPPPEVWKGMFPLSHTIDAMNTLPRTHIRPLEVHWWKAKEFKG